MRTHKKIISAFSAAVLGLSMAAGIASAQEVSDTEAELIGIDGVCTIEITSGEDIDFGDFTWDGAAYTGTAAPGAITITQASTDAPGERLCPDVQVNGTGLINGGTTAFPASAISATNAGNTVTFGPAAGVIIHGSSLPAPSIDIPVTITLTGLPSVTAPPAVYGGTITFTLAAG